MNKFLILGLIPLLLMVPGTAFADDLTFSYECQGGVWVGTITSIEGEILPNTTVRTTEKINATNYEKKFITDENGIVKIPFEDNTGSIWIQKGGFNDLKSGIEICKIEQKSEKDAQQIRQVKPVVESDIELPPPRPINPEEKEYVEPMNILGKIIRIYDDKICVEEFCKYSETLPVFVSGNIGLNTKHSIHLEITLCDRNYLLPCLDYPGLENQVIGKIHAENNGGGDFYAEWTIRKSSWTGLYQIKGVTDGKVVGEVGDSMMDMVNGLSNGKIVILNNVEKLNESNITSVTKDNATISILNIDYGQVGGVVKYEICAKQDLKNPSFEIMSDVERKDIVNEIELKKGNCHKGVISIMAKAPATITVPLATQASSSEKIDALEDEIAELKKMLQEKDKPKVPDWVKNNVQWWANGQVDDATFVNGIEFMVKEKLIDIPELPPSVSDVAEQKIPDWIRNNAVWWSEGAISEDDFVNGIEFLVQSGIIQVS